MSESNFIIGSELTDSKDYTFLFVMIIIGIGGSIIVLFSLHWLHRQFTLLVPARRSEKSKFLGTYDNNCRGEYTWDDDIESDSSVNLSDFTINSCGKLEIANIDSPVDMHDDSSSDLDSLFQSHIDTPELVFDTDIEDMVERYACEKEETFSDGGQIFEEYSFSNN